MNCVIIIMKVRKNLKYIKDFIFKAKELENSSEISIEIIQQILIDVEKFNGTDNSFSDCTELFSKIFKGNFNILLQHQDF